MITSHKDYIVDEDTTKVFDEKCTVIAFLDRMSYLIYYPILKRTN